MNTKIKQQHNRATHWKKILVLSLLVVLSGCGTTDGANPNVSADIPKEYEQNQVVKIDSCSLSGEREANVVVDIGFGD
ncbi:MAG: hypothetical protein ACRCZC_02285, partial [Culicoidibacterales bacterium]